MITVEEALSRVFEILSPLPMETIPLQAAAGRVLAQDAVATRDQPPFAASAMDGYALRGGEVSVGAQFTVIGEARAGEGFDGTVQPGEAVRIFTGAPLPSGADRIVIQEDVQVDGTRITLQDGMDTNPYVRPAAADFAVGDRLAAPRLLSPHDVGLIAAMNLPKISVHRRPVVALMATGDELVMPGEVPRPDQIIASNSFALKALLEREGAEVRQLPIARDRTEALEAGFHLAAGADLLVTTGGASVGDHDLVGPVAQKLGMDLSFYKIAMRPGKPLMVGQVLGMPLFGLPGNPVSSLVCAHIFLRPALRVLQGLPPAPLPRTTLPLGRDIGPNGKREHYERARIINGTLYPDDRQDSSLMSVLAHADALAIRPIADPARQAGETLEAIQL